MFIFADAAANYADLGSLSTFFNLGVLGVITTLWVTRKIGVPDHDERDYLRSENERLRAQLETLHESVRKEVVPALTQVAQVLPVIIDRISHK